MKFNHALLIGIGDASLDPDAWKQIDGFIEKRESVPKNAPDIMERLADIDCLLVAFATPVTEAMIAAAPKLKYIGVLATAFGMVDVAAAKKRGIVVSNLGGFSTEAVAELIFAMMLAEIRGLEEGRKRIRSGSVSEDGIEAHELRGHPFGVIGLGRIGRRIAEIAQGFGADVRYWSRNRKQDAEDRGIKYQELDELIAGSDYIALALAQIKETEGIITAARFAALKPGALLANIAPLELVDVPGLEARLAKGDITFFSDHSDEIKPEVLESLKKHPNCILYPPIGYITVEARKARRDTFLANIAGFLKGKPENNVTA
jgi:phosphoglycerate dehydrogenase-like enzyme